LTIRQRCAAADICPTLTFPFPGSTLLVEGEDKAGRVVACGPHCRGGSKDGRQDQRLDNFIWESLNGVTDRVAREGTTMRSEHYFRGLLKILSN